MQKKPLVATGLNIPFRGHGVAPVPTLTAAQKRAEFNRKVTEARAKRDRAAFGGAPTDPVIPPAILAALNLPASATVDDCVATIAAMGFTPDPLALAHRSRR